MNENGNGATTLAYLRGEKDLLQERERFEQAKKQLQSSGPAFLLHEGQKRRLERFWKVASLLQENSRMSLTEMSRKLRVPIATLFETLKEVEKHFQFTIVPREREKEALATAPSLLELGYQLTIETSPKEAENSSKE